MRRTLGAALALAGLAALGTADAVHASPNDTTDPVRTVEKALEPGARVLIINNHMNPVVVFAVREDGTRYRLGRLNRARSELFAVPEAAIEGQSVLVKVYPVVLIPGLGSPVDAGPGIKTRLPATSDVPSMALWLEPVLTDSFTQSADGA